MMKRTRNSTVIYTLASDVWKRFFWGLISQTHPIMSKSVAPSALEYWRTPLTIRAEGVDQLTKWKSSTPLCSCLGRNHAQRRARSSMRITRYRNLKRKIEHQIDPCFFDTLRLYSSAGKLNVFVFQVWHMAKY